MKKTFATLGLQNQEFEELKRCIRKVPILAQCVNIEKDRVKRVNSTRPASTRIFPLSSGQDEGSCSQENLNRDIRGLKDEGDVPTLELITCYRNLRDNPEFNRQIEDSLHKEVYKKICSVLNRLVEEDEAALEELLTKQRRVLGDDHPDTLESLLQLGNTLNSKGEFNRALPLFQEWFAQAKAQAPFPQAQAQAQAPFPIEIQSTTLPTLPNSTLPNSTGGKSKNKRNHKNKSFRSTRRRRYSRARGGKKIAASSSKTIKRRRKNAR